MDSHLRSQVVFHLTGRRTETDALESGVSGLRPALLAAYRDLDALRYDFPLVLCGGEDYVQSLSAAVDRVLRKLAPEGVTGEGMRRRVLKVEREIRRQVAAGARGTLLQLWDKASDTLATQADDEFVRDVRRARGALGIDGDVAGCDRDMPSRFMLHAWSVVQREKARAARDRIDSLVIRLGDILRADYMRSEQALQQPALKASFGSAHHGLFDFGAMSKVLQRVGPPGGLGERRRARVEQARSVLTAQRFFPSAGESDDKAGASGVHEFSFDSPAEALAAFRARLPELVQLLKALQVAELEVEGSYREELHDPIFAALDESDVTTQDLRFFPDYLVCIGGREQGEQAQLAEALSSGVPLKIVVQVDDLLEEAAPGRGHFAFGLRSARLASAAMSFDEVFVLQSAVSNLLQLRSRVQRGLRHPGPALFSIYAGPPEGTLPGYLAAAAAMQSRAFPAFTYDPGAGPDLASRFSLENNPQPEHDWPVEKFSYADQDLQSVTEDVAFTFVDFVACDPRYAGHFAAVPRASWGDSMVPAHEWLDESAAGRGQRCAVRAGGRRRRPAVPPGRGRPAHAFGNPLPRRLAPVAGIRRHPRLACRASRRARAPGLGRAAAARAAGCAGSRRCTAVGKRNAGVGASCIGTRGGRYRRACAQSGRPLHRDHSLLDLQRMHAVEPPHVRVQREQAGVHRRREGGDVRATGAGRRELPGLGDPPGQAAGHDGAGARRVDRAREAVPVKKGTFSFSAPNRGKGECPLFITAGRSCPSGNGRTRAPRHVPR